MGIRTKLFGRNAKILPGSMTFNQNCDWDSDDDDSASTDIGSMKSSSFASSRPHSRASSAAATSRKRPVVEISSPASASSRRSAWDSPASLKTPKAQYGRKSHARNDLSHLVGPTQPWDEYIQGYATNIVKRVGGTQEAWINVLSVRTEDVRTALILSGIGSKRSNKPPQLPQEIQKVLKALLDSLPREYRNDTAKLTFALQERPFYRTALEQHVELVLWGIVSARNSWM